jgi:hypothetical protein
MGTKISNSVAADLAPKGSQVKEWLFDQVLLHILLNNYEPAGCSGPFAGAM